MCSDKRNTIVWMINDAHRRETMPLLGSERSTIDSPQGGVKMAGLGLTLNEGVTVIRVPAIEGLS